MQGRFTNGPRRAPLHGGLGRIPVAGIAMMLLLLASGAARAATGSPWKWTTSAGPLECKADSDRILEGTELWIRCYSTRKFSGATVDFDVVWTQLGSHGTGYRFSTWQLTFHEGTRANHEQAVKIFIPDDGLPEGSNRVLKIWGKMSFKFGTKSVFGIPIWVTTDEAVFTKTLYVDDDDGKIVLSATPAEAWEGTIRAVTLKARMASGDTPPNGMKVDVEVGSSSDSATEGTDYTTIPKQSLVFNGSSSEATATVTLSAKGNDGLDPGETISVTGVASSSNLTSSERASWVAPTVQSTAISIDNDTSPDLTLKLSVPADTTQRTPTTKIQTCENGGTPNSNGTCVGSLSGTTTRVTVTAAEAYSKERKVLVKVGGQWGDSASSGTHYHAVPDFNVTIDANETVGTYDINFRTINDSKVSGSTHLTVVGTETGANSLNANVSSARMEILDDDANTHSFDMPLAPLEIKEQDQGAEISATFPVNFDSNSSDGVNRGLTCAWKATFQYRPSVAHAPTLPNKATPTSNHSQSPGDYWGGAPSLNT